jgi:hypothetical protein
LKSYDSTVTCRPILDDPKDDREANEALADLEQSRDAR